MAIVSLGWLGLELYHTLSHHEYNITGSYFNQKKNIKNEFHFDINSNQIPTEILAADIIVLCIPPSTIDNEKNLFNFLTSVVTKQLIFISSTSVYGNQGQVDETTTPIPESQNGKKLVRWESFISENFKHYQIIRSAGQYGGNRHPGYYLSGKKDIQGESNPINLISREDLADIFSKAINLKDSMVINAVNTHHPLKKEFYTSFCEVNNQPLPHFKDDKETKYKIVKTIHPNFIIDSPLIKSY